MLSSKAASPSLVFPFIVHCMNSTFDFIAYIRAIGSKPPCLVLPICLLAGLS
jgi:hypothetical protein